MNRAQPLLDWALSQPDKHAIRTKDGAYTYGQLAAGIRSAAYRLQDVVGRGVRVGLQMRNSPHFTETGNEQDGNFAFHVKDGYSHDGVAAMEYTYNGLRWFWNR